jgi:hypothetical protein
MISKRIGVVMALLLATPALGKPGDSFASMDEAALDAINYLIKEHPDWKKYEYSGCIYQEGKVFKASLPETIYEPKRCVTPDPPKGTVMMGSYHNHTSKEDFSLSVDLNTNDTWPLYLLTPQRKDQKAYI